MQKTDIEWATHTWNPVRGCTKISEGCRNCYAERFAERWRGIPGHPFENGFDLKLVPEKLEEPLRVKKPARVFVNSMSDLFHKDVPDEFIDKVFAVMALCPQHTFLVLTKRPERMNEWFSGIGDLTRRAFVAGQISDITDKLAIQPFIWPLPNVWLGVSVENQKAADTRIPELIKTPAILRFLSIEPLLESVDISSWLINATAPGPDHQFSDRYGFSGRLHWAIVGGESGPGCRQTHIGWLHKIARQCQEANVPVFVKQLGAKPTNCGTPIKISDKKGGNLLDFPEDLRIRQTPEVRA